MQNTSRAGRHQTTTKADAPEIGRCIDSGQGKRKRVSKGRLRGVASVWQYSGTITNGVHDGLVALLLHSRLGVAVVLLEERQRAQPAPHHLPRKPYPFYYPITNITNVTGELYLI